MEGPEFLMVQAVSEKAKKENYRHWWKWNGRTGRQMGN